MITLNLPMQVINIVEYYFLWLPTERKVLFSNVLAPIPKPDEFHGDPGQFMSSRYGSNIFIPLDAHMALALHWVTPERLTRNMPYLSETMRAAISLGVTK